jgi:hypothetical protein
MLMLRRLADRLCQQHSSVRQLVLLTALPRLLAVLVLTTGLALLGPMQALALVAAAWVGRMIVLLVVMRG